MKKPILLLPVFLLFVSWAFGGERYFKSNSLGQTLLEIPRYRTGEFEFVLTLTDEDGLVIRTLTQNGEEIERWNRQYQDGILRNEEVYESGVLTEKRLWGPLGEVQQELGYGADGLEEQRVYMYEEDLVKEIRVYDATGAWMGTYDYIRGSGKRLRMVKKTDEGEPIFSYYAMEGGRVFLEWHGDGANGDLFRFDENAKLSKNERWDGGELSLVEDFSPTDKGKTSLLVNYREGIKTEKLFDGEDRLLRERTLKEGVLVRVSDFSYDTEGNIAVKLVRTPGLKEEWRYLYDGDGDVAEETYITGGGIRKIITYTGDKTRYEEIYRAGSPFLRVYYDTDEKIREEFITPESAGGRGRALP